MSIRHMELRDRVYSRSQQVILDNQQPGGGYLACPNMPDYHFSWFRDGAFIAYALTIDGLRAPIAHPTGTAAQWDSAGRFHDWCARMINTRAGALERTMQRAGARRKGRSGGHAQRALHRRRRGGSRQVARISA